MLDNTPTEQSTMNRTSRQSNNLVVILLTVVLVIGGYFRFVGLNWDDFTHLHPDERFLTQVLSAVGGDLNLGTDIAANERYNQCLQRYPDTNGRGLYFDGYFDASCSALNPNNVGYGLYVYGTLPLFIADIASDRFADVMYQLAVRDAVSNDETVPTQWEYDIWRGYNGAHLVWRALNGASDLLVIVFLFLIGRRLHGSWVGLLAAALYAAAPLPIQKAHFATVNSMANLFGVLALYYAVRVQDKGQWGDYFAFGVAFAAALASRINLVPLVVLILLASGLRMLPAIDMNLAWHERRRIITKEFGGLVLAGIVTIISFRIFQPYAFAGPHFLSVDFDKLLSADHTLGIFNEEWLQNIGQAQYLVSGEAESPPNWQWVNRTGYVFPFTNMVLWGMGIAAGLMAWLGWLWGGVNIVRGRLNSVRNLLPVTWILVYFAWIGNLWVMSMRYYLPLYPALILLGAWLLVTLYQQSRTKSAWMRYGATALIAVVTGFTLLWGTMFTNIYRNQLTRVQASHWVWERMPGDFSMVVEGAPEETPLINIAIFNRFGADGQLDAQASILEPNFDYTYTFTAPADGVIREVLIPHLGAVVPGGDSHQLRVGIYTEDGSGLLSQGELVGEFSRQNHPIGETYTLELEAPIPIETGRVYTFRASVESTESLLIAGAVVSHEGSWDDPIPTIVCTLPEGITLADNPPSGLNNARDCNGRNAYAALVNGHGMVMALDDVDLKRDNIKMVLDESDYLVISSNRFYDSMSRNPERWPMTVAYYDALFDGAFGFELVATFQETFEFDPFRVSDQHLPTMDAPKWLNEFEAEEAFHVYDHPVVFIFQKTDNYQPETVARVLDSVSLLRAENVGIGSFNDPTLIGLNPLYSLPVDEIPTQLKLKPENREIQTNGGTWSERFNRDSLVNVQPIVTVVVWWLLIMLFGWACFPLSFVMFPALTDRGYTVSKLIGLLLVAWSAWVLTSLNLYLWSGNGLWMVFILFTLMVFGIGWRQRQEIAQYAVANWKRLVAIEVLTLGAFLLFLAIRLTNPDLWHPVFGGEKPMDFAYFNAVLRSTTFPPIDPWHAGGYINYYYFGFVLVGAPVLMLGIVPSIAYNLILPTLFALTGMGAFAVAFNIVAALRPKDEHDITAKTIQGSAWTAGIAALLLAVLLGNLNTPRVFANGLTRLGGYTPPANMTEFLREQYISRNGEEPVGDALLSIVERSANPNAFDELQFNMSQSGEAIAAGFRGVGRLMEGEPLRISTNRWYWASTRILAEPPVSSGNAITEMPFFTFLYGDLHAHMISMPMQLLILLFLLHEVVHAGQSGRRTIGTIFAIGLGALTVGMLQGTNTWDWPTYLLLSILGLGFAWWLKWQTFSRWSLVDMLLRVGGFIALSVWLSLPYTRWYAATYGSASLWSGTKTPIWAYLIIHGHFIFLVVSLLIWETGRWLRGVYVSALRGRLMFVYGFLGFVGVILVVSLLLSILGWPVSILLIPLLVWAVILFFRPEQSRAMQFVLVLMALAIAVTLGVELIVIDGDIGRQNTVFKFYLQGWFMFSIVGGVAIAWLLEHTPRWSFGIRTSWTLFLGLLIGTTALYPVMATQARAVDRMVPDLFTLDGMDYMAQARHYEVVNSALGEGQEIDLQEDYQVIRWLQDNVTGTPVIMEAQSEAEYRWGSRISIYTGMPSVIGWNWHQRQQRTFSPMPQMVQQRVANVNAFYTTTDIPTAANILQHYRVAYVIVSALENARYPQESLDKFDVMTEMGILDVVYENGETRIYAVNRTIAQNIALGLTGSDEVAKAE